jgi:steroid delta-isomerase-like uncharacterized protein
MIAVSVVSLAAAIFAIISSNIVMAPILQEQLSYAQQTGSQSIQSEDEDKEERNNKEVVIAFTEAFNNHNASALDNLVAENIIEHRPGIQSGLDTYKQFLNSLITAFPDFHTTIDHILAEDDKVVVFTTTNGTHQGPFILAPVPPTGKQVSFKAADMYRIENGKIEEHWDVIDSLDMLREIGAITFNMPSSSSVP